MILIEHKSRGKDPQKQEIDKLTGKKPVFLYLGHVIHKLFSDE